MIPLGVGGGVNIAAIGQQLAGCGYYSGVVELCVSVARQRDVEDTAMHHYSAGCPANDGKGELLISIFFV